MGISRAFANLNSDLSNWSTVTTLIVGEHCSPTTLLSCRPEPTVVGREVATKIWNHLEKLISAD
jgi:hypothetical protein